MNNLHTTKKQSYKTRHIKRFIVLILVALLFCVTGIDNKMTLYAATEESSEVESSSTNGVTRKVTVSNSQFDMELSYGLDGYALFYYPFPISIKVKSSSDFTGEIAVRMISDASSYISYTTEYVQDVSLAAGTENTVDFLISSVETTGIRIQIRNEDGNVLYEEEDTIPLKTSGNNVAIGILSDDYSGLAYFDGVTATVGSYSALTTILALDEDSFPEEESALSIINYLIIDNFDTSKLNDRQYEALKKWVNSGGILICALGANYQNVLHVFSDDFITGSFGSISKKDIVFTDEVDLNGNDLSISVSNVDVIDFTYDDSEEISDLSDGNTAYTRRIGNGAVVMLGYSLSMEPITGDACREEIAEAIISKTAVSGETEYLLEYSYNDTYDYYNGSSITENYYGEDQPNLKFYLVIFAVYIILVGPVLYLVLKKLNKRQYIWAGIPAAALLFTIIVLITGNSIKVKDPIVSTFSLIELGDNTAPEKIFAEIVYPEAKDYSIDLSDDYYDINTYDDYSDYYYYYDTTSEPELTLSVKDTANGTNLQSYNDSIFNSMCISMSKLKQNDFGSIDSDITLYTDGMEGTVTNNTNYDFEFMMITEGTSYLILEDVKAGETVDVTRDMFTYYSSIWSFLSYYYPGGYYDNQGYSINNYVYEALNCEGGNGHCYIWGLTDYSENITDSDVLSYGGSVFYTDFYESYADHTGFYTSDINNYISSSSGDYDTEDNYVYDDSVEIRYTFSDEIVRLTNVSQADGEQYDDYYGNEYSEVYALNYTNNTYEKIFIDGNVLEGEDLKDFLSGNSITLKYSGSYTIMPTISAEGEE